ncbi:hypothetical protein HYH03_014076 [Edaphochlamys debaryana]|uniref:Uncharacterized protein n=1 Tax=Edaphochlamys debaryana TaxID=47281 RepID=A0A836BTY5_9CHLO|nr:hypothetical protein HYH03_014076 [Edaphochlamys debaryana]|eukprot:KAG2487363.1 hypothetical protein HYH03_014076 [Edaphochlamys debaryana]
MDVKNAFTSAIRSRTSRTSAVLPAYVRALEAHGWFDPQADHWSADFANRIRAAAAMEAREQSSLVGADKAKLFEDGADWHEHADELTGFADLAGVDGYNAGCSGAPDTLQKAWGRPASSSQGSGPQYRRDCDTPLYDTRRTWLPYTGPAPPHADFEPAESPGDSSFSSEDGVLRSAFSDFHLSTCATPGQTSDMSETRLPGDMDHTSVYAAMRPPPAQELSQQWEQPGPSDLASASPGTYASPHAAATPPTPIAQHWDARRAGVCSFNGGASGAGAGSFSCGSGGPFTGGRGCSLSDSGCVYDAPSPAQSWSTETGAAPSPAFAPLGCSDSGQPQAPSARGKRHMDQLHDFISLKAPRPTLASRAPHLHMAPLQPQRVQAPPPHPPAQMPPGGPQPWQDRPRPSRLFQQQPSPLQRPQLHPQPHPQPQPSQEPTQRLQPEPFHPLPQHPVPLQRPQPQVQPQGQARLRAHSAGPKLTWVPGPMHHEQQPCGATQAAPLAGPPDRPCGAELRMTSSVGSSGSRCALPQAPMRSQAPQQPLPPPVRTGGVCGARPEHGAPARGPAEGGNAASAAPRAFAQGPFVSSGCGGGAVATGALQTGVGQVQTAAASASVPTFESLPFELFSVGAWAEADEGSLWERYIDGRMGLGLQD